MATQKVNFPEEKSVYDWNFNVKTNEWENWFDTIPAYSVDIKDSFNEIVVPTQDSIRMKTLLKMLILNNKHVLMPGPIGVGKSVYIQQLATFEMPDEFQTLKMTFSAKTSANQTQDFMDGKFEKHRKGVYGPPIGKKYIVFVDDLNMPMKEEFFAMPPIELLRQFDRIDKEKPFRTLKNLIFVSAMGPPGGGRQEITQRLQRHYNFLTYTEMMPEAMTTIFTTILSAFYHNFTQASQETISPLVEASLEVYDNILPGHLKPIPSKSHYTFNLRDISKIFQGISSANYKLCTQPVDVVRLWIHENKRVFGDRLTDNKDRNYLEDMLMEKSQSKFALSKKEIMNSERLIFGDFMDGIDQEIRVYK
jgi:dynein heavy chain, axonemal